LIDPIDIPWIFVAEVDFLAKLSFGVAVLTPAEFKFAARVVDWAGVTLVVCDAFSTSRQVADSLISSN